jgi:hypothetical protein
VRIPSGSDCAGNAHQPVCACDGTKYKNPCKANQNSQSLLQYGSCPYAADEQLAFE